MKALSAKFVACQPVFTALGNEHRQLIFVELLRHYGGMRACELAETAGLSRATVSHHLKILKEAHLVDMYESGTLNFYHASADLDQWHRIAELTSEAERFVSAWVKACENGLERPLRTS